MRSPIKFLKLSAGMLALALTIGCSSKSQENNIQSLYQPKNDTLFKVPYIDKDEWRDKPVRHRYVHGGFKGTDTRFSFYFPEKVQYQGRFYQYVTPFPDNETLSQGAFGEEDKIGFSIESGAYFVETNGGGAVDLSKPVASNDGTIGAFKANAACADYSRKVAAKMYGNHRTYGYLFGGSGGAYRTVGGIENTDGVWDGAVPYVLGSPMAIPNNFTVRMHAMRILKSKFPQIIDAVEPGGSGDMYAGLNQEERDALMEVTKMGFPPQSWYGYNNMGVHGFVAVYQGMVGADPTYFEKDFWHIPGYLGAKPTASLLKARIQKVSIIQKGIPTQQAVALGLIPKDDASERGTADLAWKSMGKAVGTMPVAFQLTDRLPDVDFLGGDLIIKSGKAAGKRLQLTKVIGDKVVFGPVDAAVLSLVKAGDTVQVDNSNFLAAQTYHRHQVPEEEYTEYDQFRNADGKPIYPQRPNLLGPGFTKSAAGVLPTGKFKGKMIVLSSLWDREAYAWHADWYRSQVKKNLGNAADDHFKIWYTDHALHGDQSMQEDMRTVSYLGVLHQALRDLSAWVEKGTPPPSSTNYKIEGGQVIVPELAADRKGIQPVVKLTANGANKVIIKAGQSVNFSAQIDLPENTGKVISATWYFDGSGTSAVSSPISMATQKNSVGVQIAHTFTKRGVYFPVLLAVSQRNGNTKTPFAKIRNVGRVRVVVN